MRMIYGFLNTLRYNPRTKLKSWTTLSNPNRSMKSHFVKKKKKEKNRSLQVTKNPIQTKWQIKKYCSEFEQRVDRIQERIKGSLWCRPDWAYFGGIVSGLLDQSQTQSVSPLLSSSSCRTQVNITCWAAVDKHTESVQSWYQHLDDLRTSVNQFTQINTCLCLCIIFQLLKYTEFTEKKKINMLIYIILLQPRIAFKKNTVQGSVLMYTQRPNTWNYSNKKEKRRCELVTWVFLFYDCISFRKKRQQNIIFFGVQIILTWLQNLIQMVWFWM